MASQHSVSLRKVTLLSAGGAFLDGYDLLIINAALLSIVPAFDLSNGETGLLTSLPFLGMVVGALVAGRLCDRFGRRRVFLVDVLVFLVVSLLLAAAQDWWQLVVLRTALGLAIGMDMPTGTSMLAEFAPRGRLGRLTAMMQTMWVFGGLVAAAVGYGIYELTGPDSWRWMFVSSAVPAVVIAIARHSLPETPRWRAQPRSGARAPGIGTIARIRRYRKPVVFFTAYWAIESFLGGPPFIYTALIFSTVVQFSGSEALLLSAALSAVYVAANVLVQYRMLDQAGRKPVAMIMCAVAALAAVATGLLQHGGIALVIAFGVFAVCTQLAPLPFWPWSVEQLPTRIRATGQSIGSAGAKLGQFIGLNLFTAGTIAAIGWLPYFCLVGVAFALLTGYVALRGKETRGADLESLDHEENPAAHPEGAERA